MTPICACPQKKMQLDLCFEREGEVEWMEKRDGENEGEKKGSE